MLAPCRQNCNVCHFWVPEDYPKCKCGVGEWDSGLTRDALSVWVDDSSHTDTALVDVSALYGRMPACEKNGPFGFDPVRETRPCQ